ncbi:hypothetical protein [Prochlorococcus sp. MIT 1341]|uniref:hypothetical protein n=1 Tax=Prochlorococcus sp. MIT 1341 TaxID=3096221 RepID=UPI002A75E17D|nr:hypothetical protein [Prochlorococcus sp. MIT 1341]
MNASDHVHSIDLAQALASSVTLVRRHFPSASVNLAPWRDDPQTRKWSEAETLDFSFHFPGWTPRLQCRSLLLQLRFSTEKLDFSKPYLLGVLIRGMTFEGERWRLATVGEWNPTGPYLPESSQLILLKEICRDLFSLFPPSN